MATKLADMTETTVKPTGFAQFGNRAVICYDDLRPLVVMPDATGTLTCYNAGIKPPTTAPTVAQGATNANIPNYSEDDFRHSDQAKAYVAYAFYSSTRNVMSMISPEASPCPVHTILTSREISRLTRDGYFPPGAR